MSRSLTLYSLKLPRGINYMVYVMDDGDKIYASWAHFESFDKFMTVKSRVFNEEFMRWMDFLNGW